MGLATIELALGTTVVSASTRSNAPVDDATRTYWLKAHQLTQEQVTILDRVEQSTRKPEAKRLRTLSGQVLLHASAVDRFLKSNYPDPVLLCSPPAGLGGVAGTDSASPEQVQAYCSLYRSNRGLATIKTRLDLQAKLLTPHSASSRLKPVHQSAKAPINLEAVNASNRMILTLVQSSRQHLAQMQPAFPEALRLLIAQPMPHSDQAADSRSR